MHSSPHFTPNIPPFHIPKAAPKLSNLSNSPTTTPKVVKQKYAQSHIV